MLGRTISSIIKKFDFSLRRSFLEKNHCANYRSNGSCRSKKIGSKESRVGVFGPYPEGGEKVIMKVAKMVSELKFAAITGRGFFLPRQPKVFHSIRELIPPYAHKARKVIPDHIIFHEFPRLVSKGIFFENEERGQLVELQGCLAYEIPVLGFIRHKTISASRSCNFLIVKKIIQNATSKIKSFVYMK
ncbi:MAG: hypothetical protein ACE5J9_07980 [Methanosarcinales archaeon]